MPTTRNTLRRGMSRMAGSAALAAVMIALPAPVEAGSTAPPDRDTLFQVSTVGALQQGLFQPAMTVARLREHGNFGLGTYEGLDGEMVVAGGTVYQVPFSGRGRIARNSQETPFAVVTFFDADRRFRVSGNVDLEGLGDAIDRRLPTTNTFYAIRVKGRFDYLQTRSVARQKKPYPSLSQALAGQRTFELRNVRGTLVGIRCPEFVGDLNVPGYHWHFITKSGKAGGHVLALDAAGIKVAVDETRNWQVQLPDTPAFNRAK